LAKGKKQLVQQVSCALRSGELLGRRSNYMIPDVTSPCSRSCGC